MRRLFAALLTLALAACSGSDDVSFQGYIDADFVNVASEAAVQTFRYLGAYAAIVPGKTRSVSPLGRNGPAPSVFRFKPSVLSM